MRLLDKCGELVLHGQADKAVTKLPLAWETSAMGIEQWWTNLQPSTRTWLIENNGDLVPPALVAEIAEAGGPASDDSWWAGQSESTGLYFPDDAIDWVEATANDEEPQ